jgi:phage terminase large subunit-like protein
LDDYVIVATSSEGTIRNNAGDSIKMELLSILKGEYYNPHVSIWYYRLDELDEVAKGLEDPRIWLKANPNLGLTVTYDTYVRDVERAESVPSSRNDILAKRFGIPMEGFTYYFTYEETLPTQKKLNCWQMPCALGADLSRGDDFCAFDFLFPFPRGEFGVKVRCYITALTLAKLPTALRVKYDEFIAEGSLIIMEGAILDMPDVYADLEAHIDAMQYEVRVMGYDPHNAKEFVQAWMASNGPYNVEKVIQGAKTETVPLGEIKILAGQRVLLFDESIMQFCMGNAVTLDDTNGNRKLVKLRNEQKIDAVSALIDAFVVYKTNKSQFD